jgi:hypothetical protein
MWIFDSYFKGCVELWSRKRGLERISAAYPPSFYMHLKDPHAHWEMVKALENRFRVEECSFNSIFGTSRATGSTPAEKWPRRSRFKPATPPSFITWTSGKIKGTWQRKTCFLAETEPSPGSLPTSKFLLSILVMEWLEINYIPKEI